ncbi:hypothetical protein AURDEDRAFT_171811 [Auricularia subglabra TFB-10046 SS5]|nr:hypothetical protein AURDEDRAFT_171811 [Auricularia subglabra TFB-10046 SS5]
MVFPRPTEIFPGPPIVCSAYPAPIPSCNVLLTRSAGLDGADRHRLTISTAADGWQFVILNAQVGNGADSNDLSANCDLATTEHHDRPVR